MPTKLSNAKLSLKVLTVLYRASSSVQSRAWSNIQESKLGLSDFAILEVLLHKGSLPINVIGAKILLTTGSMTSAIDRLESRGLVERVVHATDRRTKLVQLTEKGCDLIKPAFAAHEVAVEKITAGLTYAEKMQFIELAKKLGKYADEFE